MMIKDMANQHKDSNKIITIKKNCKLKEENYTTKLLTAKT